MTKTLAAAILLSASAASAAGPVPAPLPFEAAVDCGRTAAVEAAGSLRRGRTNAALERLAWDLEISVPRAAAMGRDLAGWRQSAATDESVRARAAQVRDQLEALAQDARWRVLELASAGGGSAADRRAARRVARLASELRAEAEFAWSDRFTGRRELVAAGLGADVEALDAAALQFVMWASSLDHDAARYLSRLPRS